MGKNDGKRPHSADSAEGTDRGSNESKKQKQEYSVLISFQVEDFKDVNPYKATSWIRSLIGEDCLVTPIKAQKAVKVDCNKQSCEKLMKQKKFEDIKVGVKRYVQEVFVKGIIHGVDIEFTDEDLKEGLFCPDHSASKFHRSVQI